MQAEEKEFEMENWSRLINTIILAVLLAIVLTVGLQLAVGKIKTGRWGSLKDEQQAPKVSKISDLGENAEGHQQQSLISELPNLRLCTMIAELDRGHKVVALCEEAEIVCIEGADYYADKVRVTGGNSRSFSCWDVGTAPKKIQGMIMEHGSRKDCGVGPC